jgi:pimeloyl-[acyl-carrier protein] methyl ester esterase
MLEIEIQGKLGPIIVLLHGWGLNREVMRPLAERLATTAQVILVDLPGYGVNRDHPFDASIEGYAQQVVEAITHHTPEPTHWMGWSLGGMIALQAALNQAPISRLTLCGTSPCFTQRFDWPHAVAPVVLDQFAQALQQDHEATVKTFLSLQAQGSEHNKEEIRQLRHAISSQGSPNPKALELGLQFLQQLDLRPLLTNIQQPTLLINGNRDTLVPISAQHEIAPQIPNSSCQMIKGAAHAPFISHPDAFIEALRVHADGI